MITIKYWGILARASGLFRMLEEAGMDYARVAEMKDMGCALFGSDSTNLAPPILVDGDITISQAAPCHQYLGNKLGFNQGIKIPEIAMQYMIDLNDLHSEMAEAAIKGKAENNVHALQEYLESDRYRRHLKAIDNSIQGPFYFGDKPTYVDFATTSYLDMCEGKWLTPLLGKTGGDTIQEYAPKLRQVVEQIRALPSAKKLEAIPQVPAIYILKEDRISTWKSSGEQQNRS